MTPDNLSRWTPLLVALGAIAGLWAGSAGADPTLRRDSSRSWNDPYGGIRVYSTPPEYVQMPSQGWVRFGDLDYSALPLVDGRTGLFARLTYANAKRAAAQLGGRLPTAQELLAIWEHGYRIKPCPLVSSEDDIEHMMSLAFARKHDACALVQLDGWSGDRPVANVGKWWAAGAPEGRAWLYGWWQRVGLKDYAIIQGTPSGPGKHSENYSDYGTLTYIVR